jgi:hypothetical protein
MHLYAGVTKMMRDVGLVDQDEPFKRPSTALNLGSTASDVEVTRQHDPDDLSPATGRTSGCSDVRGPVGSGGPWVRLDRRRSSLPEPALTSR